MAAPTYVTHVGFDAVTSGDEEAYHDGGSVTGWTLVNDVTRNYIEADDTAGDLGFNSSRNFTPLANVWISYSLLHHVGQIGTGATITVCKVRGSIGSEVLILQLVQSTDNDHFVVRFRDEAAMDIGTGTVELAVDTDFTVLAWQNGVTFRAKVDGNEDDISVAHTKKVNKTHIQGTPNFGAGDKIRIGAIAIHHSDDAADRPGVDIGKDMIVFPNGDDTQEWGDEVDCTEGETSGTYTDVDSWATTTADDTVYVCEHASELGFFMVDLTTVTISNNFTGIRMVSRRAANIASKTVSNSFVIRDADGPYNEIKKTGSNAGGDTFSTDSMEFPTEPDGGAWSSGALDVLKAGFNTASSNGANFQVSEMMIEICTIDADPPPPVSFPPISPLRAIKHLLIR